MNRNRPGIRVVPLEEPRAAVAGDCHGVSELHSDFLPRGLPCCESLEDRNWGGLIHCCVFSTKKVPGPRSVSPVVNYGLGLRRQPQGGTFILELDGVNPGPLWELFPYHPALIGTFFPSQGSILIAPHPHLHWMCSFPSLPLVHPSRFSKATPLSHGSKLFCSKFLEC